MTIKYFLMFNYFNIALDVLFAETTKIYHGARYFCIFSLVLLKGDKKLVAFLFLIINIIP